MIARGCRAVATDVATAIYYTGIDPFTKKPVYIAKQLRDRKLQRALLQLFKPENYLGGREGMRLSQPSPMRSVRLARSRASRTSARRQLAQATTA